MPRDLVILGSVDDTAPKFLIILVNPKHCLLCAVDQVAVYFLQAEARFSAHWGPESQRASFN